MSRTYVVTGAASGIGQAVAGQLREQGHVVLGVDLEGAQVSADLSAPGGLAAMAEAVRERTGVVDGVVANAGVSARNELSVAVNYFGAVGTVEALRPLLAASAAPRACVTASAASLHPHDDELLAAMLAGDRPTAMVRGKALAASGAGYLNYSTSKQAVARWVRRQAPTAAYAGARIALNAVAPGVVVTPMTRELFATEEGRRRMTEGMPSPLNGPAEARDIAAAICFLVSAGASRIAGQVLFVDSGFDALSRGDRTW